MVDRCPTDVKHEFHGMDMDIYKDFSPSEEYKMTEYERGLQLGIIVGRRSVEPKHGRWKPFDLTWGRSIYACTSCGTCMEVPTEKEAPIYAYCPNCGAQMMDEVEE